MPDEAGTGGRRLAACGRLLGAVAMIALGTREASGQAGYMQVRYERLIAEALIFRNDTTVSDTSFTRSYWTQNYQLDRSLPVRSWLNLSWQLGFQDRQAVERVDRVQVPYGHARLTARAAGLYVSLKPVTTTTAGLATIPGTVEPDSIAATQVRATSTQTIMTAYVTPTRLPRADVSWIRNSGGPGSHRTADRRDARLSQQLGLFSWRASYADQGQGERASDVRVFQRNYGAGTGFAIETHPDRSLSFDYDFSGYDRGAPGDLRTESRAHRGTANGTWRQTSKLNWNLFGWYQRSESPRLARPPFEAAEAQVYAVYQPRRAFRTQSGVQLRKAQENGRSGIESILLTSAALEGPIRPQWRGLVDASQTLVSNSFRSPYGVTTLRGHTQGRLRQGIDAVLSLQVVSNNDTIASARAASQGTASLQLTPLRTISSTLRAGLYRVGPSLGEVVNDSRTGQFDLRWTPLQNFELFGSLRRQESAAQPEVGSTLRTLFIRWSAGSMLQLDANYSGNRPDDAPSVRGAIRSRKREAWTLHGTWNFDRARQLTAQASLLDPHTSREITAYDATFTWRFWR